MQCSPCSRAALMLNIKEFGLLQCSLIECGRAGVLIVFDQGCHHALVLSEVRQPGNVEQIINERVKCLRIPTPAKPNNMSFRRGRCRVISITVFSLDEYCVSLGHQVSLAPLQTEVGNNLWVDIDGNNILHSLMQLRINCLELVCCERLNGKVHIVRDAFTMWTIIDPNLRTAMIQLLAYRVIT